MNFEAIKKSNVPKEYKEIEGLKNKLRNNKSASSNKKMMFDFMIGKIS
ncbi:hypothetical protein KFV54_13335 (plasmid) [Staphylococcus epidermidis]|nr:hypothetical protein [Staphylococcus epidermidis]QXU96444.1 hypothetical protein KFV54_13335 [Staphylococcus epidermidis]